MVLQIQQKIKSSLTNWLAISFACFLLPFTLLSQAPTAVEDEVYTWDNVTATGNLSTNDINPGNQALTYTLLSNTTFGTLTLQTNGAWTFIPTPGLASVNQIISYQVCNPSNQCSSASIAVYIQFHNDVPQPANDSLFVEMNEPRFGNVAWNDIEPDSISDPVSGIDSYSAMTAPANGSVIMNLDGTFQYTPNTNFVGNDSFMYIMCDPCGACATATVFIFVLPNNEEPVAIDSPIYQLNEDTSYSGSVAALASDPANDPLSFSALTAPMYGTVNMNVNGAFVYTPFPNYFGTDNFMFLVCDIVGQCVVAFVHFNVIDVNDPPTVVNENYTIYEDFPQLSGTAGGNDTDDGGVITYSLLQQPAHGVATVQTNGSFTYSPAANYNGQDRIFINVCDPQLLCSIDTVFISITPLNDYPVALTDDLFGYEDFPISGSVATNDYDVDGDVLTYTVTISPIGGTIVMNSNGSFVYTPFVNYSGFETITYQVCDPYNACASTTLTLEIIEINDDPIIISDIFTGIEDQVLSGDIRLNDIEPDGEPIHYYNVSAPQNGVLVLELNGQFIYTPNPNWFGTEVISFYGCDPCAVCLPATLTIIILSVNDLPVASPLSTSTNEDTAIPGNLLGQISDIDDSNFTFSIAVPASNGNFVLQPNGTFNYTPNANYFGPDQITFTACDDENGCASSTVSISINPVNDSPVAVNDSAITLEDTVLNGSVANDYDVDDNLLFYSLISPPMHGTITMSVNGSYIYTPTLNFSGMDMITYSVCDDENTCDAGVLTIEVQPVNDAPVAVNDFNVTYLNGTLNGNVGSNDNDPDGDALTFAVVTDAVNGNYTLAPSGVYGYTPNTDFVGVEDIVYSACDPSGLCSQATLHLTILSANTSPVATNSNLTTPEDSVLSGNLFSNVTDEEGGDLIFSVSTAPLNGQLSINSSGSFTYTPALNFFGSDSFVYQVCDTGPLCTTATVNINILPVNDAPAVLGEFLTINEDTSLSGNVSANDYDPEGDVMTYSTNDVSTGSFILNANGIFTFTPFPNFNGVFTVVYNVCDPFLACNTGTLNITVLSVNDGPTAINDSFTIDEDSSLAANVGWNDYDADGDLLAYAVTINVTHGNLTFNADGSFSYSPNTNYFGSDSFQYSACDNGGLCSTATVTFDIASVNDLPVANDDFFVTNEDTSVSGNVANNDIDADGTALTYSFITGDTYGTFNLNVNGQFTYTPEPDFNGFVFITYSACDPQNACSQAVLQITVNPINDPPVANDDVFTMAEDENISGDVSMNDSDVENSPLTFSLIGAAQNGVLSFNSMGAFNYTPYPDFTGVEIIVYQVCDIDGACSSATLTINVTPANDPPFALGEFVHVLEDDIGYGDLSLNDYDVDGDALTYSIVGNALHGIFILQPNGAYQYTPTPDYSGMDSVQYMVCDPQNLCVTVQIVIVVDFVNDAPVVQIETIEVIQDQLYNGSVATNDFEPDGEVLVYVIDQDNSNGIFTLHEDGTFTYLPNDGVTGTFFLTYFACDPCAVCSMGTLTIHVVLPGEENTSPVAISSMINVCQNSATTIELNDFINDVQTADALLNITYISPVHGTIEYNELTHQINYTPDNSDLTQVEIQYSVCDDGFIPLCASGVITVNVLAASIIAIDSVSISNVDCFYNTTGAINIVQVSGGENLLYQWQNGANTPNLLSLSAGEYIVTISSGTVCTIPVTQTFIVTEPEFLTSMIASSTNISGSGNGTISIDIQGGTLPYTVAWNGPSNFVSNDEDLTDLIIDGNYAAVITDAHGCTSSVSNMITPIEENIYDWSVQVMPNPFTESFNLKLDGFHGEKLDYKIYDAGGRLVLDGFAGSIESRNIFIDMKSYPAGLYQLKLISQNHVKTIGLIRQ